MEMFELADIEKNPEERRRLLTFFVAGGGFSGSELAGELADFVRRLTKREYQGIKREECRVVVVHPGPTLLPELYGGKNTERDERGYPKLVEYGMKHSRKLGVELMLETRVTGATPNEVYLSNGDHIPTRTIVSTVGSKPWPILDEIDLPKDSRGRLVTDEFLRVDGRPELWAGGDCGSVPHPKGGTCPPVALFAKKEGQQIGKNIARSLAGKPLKPFRGSVIGQGISIGNRTAVGTLKGIPMKGKMAWVSWRSVVWGYAIPSWDRRFRLLADWLIWPFVGRDIVQMGPSETDRLRRAASRLPAGRGDRRERAPGAARPHHRRGRSRGVPRQRRQRRAARDDRRRRPFRAQVARAAGAQTRRARSRSSARSRSTRTRRTSSRTCCSRPSGSSRERASCRRSTWKRSSATAAKTPSSLQLAGRSILVTGASSGIGAATARAVARKGATAVLLARTQAKLEAVAAEITAEGGRAHAYAVDCADREAVAAVAPRIEADIGIPDVIVNNAGAGRHLFFEETDPRGARGDDGRAVLRGRLRDACLPPGDDRAGQRLHRQVNAPIAFVPWQGAAGYGAARWALRGLSEVLRADLRGSGVNVGQVVAGEGGERLLRAQSRRRGAAPADRAADEDSEP